MKKLYTKPFIAVESFQLNAALAASCSTSDPARTAINHGINSCTPIEEKESDIIIGTACGSINLIDIVNDPNAVSPDGVCYHGFAVDVRAIYLES